MTEPGNGAVAAAAHGWLVVIDMQHVFADRASPWSTPGFDAALAQVQTLVAAFGDRVVYTRFVAPMTPTGAWRAYYEQWPFALVPHDHPTYAIVDALPHAGRPVVTRATFGKWDDDPGSLGELTGGAPALVLAGVSTDCCVLSTALAAADAGVQVYVAADACAAPTPQDHDRALDAMRLYAPLITVTTTEALTAEGAA